MLDYYDADQMPACVECAQRNGHTTEEAELCDDGSLQCPDCPWKPKVEMRSVIIPAREQHEGFYTVTVTVPWVCPTCGGPRGEVRDTISYDGSRRLGCHGWSNPCGHVDFYSDVRKEAAELKRKELGEHENHPGT